LSVVPKKLVTKRKKEKRDLPRLKRRQQRLLGVFFTVVPAPVASHASLSCSSCLSFLVPLSLVMCHGIGGGGRSVVEKGGGGGIMTVAVENESLNKKLVEKKNKED
jgi:hypothetical protein